MKMKKTDRAIIIAASVLAVITMVYTTYIGFMTNNPFQAWIFPILAGACLLFWLIQRISDYRLAKWAENHKKLKETGVIEYLSNNTSLFFAERAGKYESLEDWFARAVMYTAGKTFDTRGYICGEDVVGVVENMQLFVTVTKPETAKAFRSLPRSYRKFITVIEAFS